MIARKNRNPTQEELREVLEQQLYNKPRKSVQIGIGGRRASGGSLEDKEWK